MKILLILSLLFVFFQNEVYGDYIVLVDGEVVYEENSHHVQSVASISKVMTALVAIENSNIHDVITIDQKTTEQIGSSLYMHINERYTLLSLIYGLMLRSGNDAAYAISEHVGGNQENFVLMMNDKAKELGMKDTIFSNPSGLDEFDDGNQSTVYDMALCMQAAMKNDIFRVITNTKQYKAENNRVWVNKNRLLKEYEYCNGGKTGYTKQSGKTLITSANYNGMESIVVSFRESDYFMLHKRYHEEVNEKYKTIVLIQKGEYQIKDKKIIIEEDIKTILYKDQELDVQTKLNENYVLIQYNRLDSLFERKVILT